MKTTNITPVKEVFQSAPCLSFRLPAFLRNNPANQSLQPFPNKAKPTVQIFRETSPSGYSGNIRRCSIYLWASAIDFIPATSSALAWRPVQGWQSFESSGQILQTNIREHARFDKKISLRVDATICPFKSSLVNADEVCNPSRRSLKSQEMRRHVQADGND